MASKGSIDGEDDRLLHSKKFPREMKEFTWKIEEFGQVKASSEMIKATSTTFEMGRSIGFPVKLQASLIPSEEDQMYVEESITVGITAVAKPKGAQAVMAKFRIKIEEYVAEHLTYPVDLKHIWSLTLGLQATSQRRIPVDQHGNLTIFIEVIVYNILPVRTIPDLMSKFQEGFVRKLTQDIGKLRKKPGSSAGAPEIVKVISKNGKEFSVNWLILAARSPVFCTLFQTSMSEVKEGVLKIEDIGGETLDVILEFLHTAMLQKKWKQPGILEEVIQAAHKYMIKDLLEFLEEAMELLSSPENCVTLLRLAHTLGLKKAEKTLMDKCWKQAKGPEEFMQLFQECNLKN